MPGTRKKLTILISDYRNCTYTISVYKIVILCLAVMIKTSEVKASTDTCYHDYLLLVVTCYHDYPLQC